VWIQFKQTSNADATELGIVEDDWGQRKAAISFQEYTSFDNECNV
jgi:hypothetical protein